MTRLLLTDQLHDTKQCELCLVTYMMTSRHLKFKVITHCSFDIG